MQYPLHYLFVPVMVCVLTAFAIAPLAAETPAQTEPGPALEPRTVAGLELVLQPIPAGTFLMGSPADEPGHNPDEGPRTKVTVTKAFWLGKYPVTQGQWHALMGTDVEEQAWRMLNDDSLFDFGKRETIRDMLGVTKVCDPKTLIGNAGDNYPIYYVSWNEAAAFCQKLTDQERYFGRLPKGYEYRLPTEAEWEYACRAGVAEATYAGKMEIKGKNNVPVLDAIAWYGGNSSAGYTGHGFSTAAWLDKQYPGGDAGPREVGGKQPNAWGLYDMLGNLSQWCGDWQADKLPGGSVTDPSGPPAGAKRVNRGGGWYSSVNCRSSYRNGNDPGYRSNVLGFRVALGAIR